MNVLRIMPTFFKLFFLLLLLSMTACQTTRPPASHLGPTATPNFAPTAISTLQVGSSWKNKNLFYALAISPSGALIALGGEKNIQLLDATEGRQLQNLAHSTGDILSLIFSPDSNVLAAGGKQHTALWHTQSGENLGLLQGKTGDITALAFSPDGQRLATGGVGEQTEITIWNILTQKPEMIQAYNTTYADSLQALAFSPDGTHLAAAGRDQQIRIWRLQQPASAGSPVQILYSPGLNPAVLVFSPDLQTLAVGTAEGPILLYSLQNGKLLKTLHQHRGPIQSLAFQDEGSLLLSAGQDQILRHWQLQSGEVIKTAALKGAIEIIQISQNATTLVAQGITQTDIFAVHPIRKNRPQIIIHNPQNPAKVFENKIRLMGTVSDAQGIAEVSIQINNVIWAQNRGQSPRDLSWVTKTPQTQNLHIDEDIPLRSGENSLTITARNLAA